MYNVIKIKERLNKLKPGENKSPVCNLLLTMYKIKKRERKHQDPVAVCRPKNKIDIGENEWGGGHRGDWCRIQGKVAKVCKSSSKMQSMRAAAQVSLGRNLVFTSKDVCMLKCVFQGSSWKDRSGKVHLESCGGFQKWLDSQSGAGGSSVARTEIGGEEECGGCIGRGHQDRGNQWGAGGRFQ